MGNSVFHSDEDGGENDNTMRTYLDFNHKPVSSTCPETEDLLLTTPNL